MKVLLVCAFLVFHHVDVEAYRLPIPYGTGFQDKQLAIGELVKQDFLGRIWSLLNLKQERKKMMSQKGRLLEVFIFVLYYICIPFISFY